MILDDSVLDKNFSKKIENACRQWSGNARKVITDVDNSTRHVTSAANAASLCGPQDTPLFIALTRFRGRHRPAWLPPLPGDGDNSYLPLSRRITRWPHDVAPIKHPDDA